MRLRKAITKTHLKKDEAYWLAGWIAAQAYADDRSLIWIGMNNKA